MICVYIHTASDEFKSLLRTVRPGGHRAETLGSPTTSLETREGGGAALTSTGKRRYGECFTG